MLGTASTLDEQERQIQLRLSMEAVLSFPFFGLGYQFFLWVASRSFDVGAQGGGARAILTAAIVLPSPATHAILDY